MRMLSLLCVLLASVALVQPIGLAAHPADTLWMRTYGSTGDEVGYDVQQTPDLGFVITGYSAASGYPSGDLDIYVARTSSDGSQLWEREFGGPNWDIGHSLTVTPDGGIAVAGVTHSFGPGRQAMFLLRLDEEGDSLWLRTYGGNGSEKAYSVEQTQDGGFILAGLTTTFGRGESNVYLVRTDSLGRALWSRVYGGDKSEAARSIIQTPDGGFILAGRTESFAKGLNDFYVVRTDAEGIAIWERAYGGYQNDEATSICRLPDGMYVVAGYSDSYHQNDIDGYMIKIDSLGYEHSSMYTNQLYTDRFESVSPSNDGGCVVVGMGMCANNPELFLVKTDDRLTVQWYRAHYLCWGYGEDYGRAVRRTAEGSYIICGYTTSFGAGGTDAFLIKTIDTVVPAQPEFEVIPGDGQVTFRWTNPQNADVLGTHIRWATKTYPEKPDWGWPVPGPDDAHFAGAPGESGTSTYAGLLNGQKYFFCAFAYDNSYNYSLAAKAKATPRDSIPPEPPSEFEAMADGNNILLSWNHSESTDIIGTHICFSTGSYPAAPDSGHSLPNGHDGDLPGEPGAQDSFRHEWLVTDQRYYYSAFAFDSSGNYSLPDTASAVPVDLVPPGSPQVFVATPGEGMVTLEWRAAATPDVEGVHIRFSDSDYPSHPDSGYPIPNGENGEFACDPSSDGMFAHHGLINGRAYYYSAFCYDEVHNCSTPATALAQPCDITPPDISVAVLQNPYLTRYLDIYLIGEEVLGPIPPSLTAGATSLEFGLLDTLNQVWRMDYELPDTAGIVSLVCAAFDSVGNDTTVTALLSSTPLGAGQGCVARSPRGELTLTVDPGCLQGCSHVLILSVAEEATGRDPDGFVPLALGLPTAGRHPSTAYLIAPANALKRGEAYLEWQYDETILPEGAPPSGLYIEEGEASQLECFVDPERRVITASTSHLGLFRVRWSSEAASQSADPDFMEVGPCYPNPCSHTVTVNFTVKSRQHVHVGIFDLRGRLVKTLLDGVANPGCRSILWDGTTDRHSKVPPGVYFVRINNFSRSHAVKLTLIR